MHALQDLIFVSLTVVCFVALLGFVRALVRI
ncbi:hypothetical protein COAQ111491_00265 [Comamonas aquatilis]